MGPRVPGETSPGARGQRLLHIGLEECLTVVIDGMGETESASVYRARGGRLEPLCSVSVHDSIGILYSLITLHLGFDFNSDEYKIMGLAPYGDPSRFRKFFEETVIPEDDGSIRIPILRLNRTSDERENYAVTRKHLSRALFPPRDPDGEILTNTATRQPVCRSAWIAHCCTCAALMAASRASVVSRWRVAWP